MGGDCSKGNVQNQIGIVGNGNSAFILNDAALNLSKILESTIIFTAKYYRSQWIAVHLVSILLMCLFTSAIILYKKSNYRTEKGIIYRKERDMCLQWIIVLNFRTRITHEQIRKPHRNLHYNFTFIFSWIFRSFRSRIEIIKHNDYFLRVSSSYLLMNVLIMSLSSLVWWCSDWNSQCIIIWKSW